MEFIYDDGGRKDAGFIGKTGDCATRAISIVTGMEYKQVYDGINQMAMFERIGKRKRSKSNARTGVYTQTVRKYMKWLGWEWKPTMFIGSGCHVHFRKEELPMGKLVVVASKHYVSVIDGVIHDTFDPSRNGTRCVYGYFYQPA